MSFTQVFYWWQVLAKSKAVDVTSATKVNTSMLQEPLYSLFSREF